MNKKWIVGKWVVDLEVCSIRKRHHLSRTMHIDPRLGRVLDVLIGHAGTTVPPHLILEIAWKDRVVSVESVSTAIYQLRKLLSDNSKSPEYIVTVPQDGYKLVAPTRRLRQWRLGRLSEIAPGALALGLIVISALSSPDKYVSSNSLFVSPIVDSTGDPEIRDLTIAVDATFVSALVRVNPDIAATRSQDARTTLRLESEVVACDTGPTWVLTLIDTENQQFLWSEYYDFDGSFDESSMIEHAAMQVARALSET